MDISKTIEPKSDQLNADDLIGGSKTIKITDVKLLETDQQPVHIHYEGDDGKPYKPSKGMRRVLVELWGVDADKYKGHLLTLYRDGNVKFAGSEVGGIRISHATGIDKPKKVLITISRGKRKPDTIQPLKKDVNTLTNERFKKALEMYKNGEIQKEDITKYELTEKQIKELG